MDKIEFIISVFGSRYLLFLATCLQSIKNHHPDSLVSVYFDDISPKIIKIFSKYFENCTFTKCNIKTLLPDSKSKLNTKILYWNYAINNTNSKNLCFIDVDTILIKPINEVFDVEFDISLTYNDHSLNRIPINTGVIFCKNNKNSKMFFEEWTKRVEKFANNPSKYTELFSKYGSGDQLCIMMMLEEKITKTNSIYIVNNIDMKINWLKCTEFNNLSSPNIRDNCKVIHLKSKWHRIILDNVPIETIETRKDSQPILDKFLSYKEEVANLLKEINI
jgi:hypothetical protein